MTIPNQDGDLYFTVETYLPGAVPNSCWQMGDAPSVTFNVYKGDTNNLIQSVVTFNIYNWPIQVLEADYAAGDKFIITVQYNWWYGFGRYPARDYTLKLYSKH